MTQVFCSNIPISLYFHMPDSISQKAEVIHAGGAFRGGGQRSEEQRSRRQNTSNSWKSPERNTNVQKTACSTYIRGPCDVVVGETRHIPSLVWTLQFIPLCPSIIHPTWKSLFFSKRHNQPREVTSPTRSSRYADIFAEKYLKSKTKNSCMQC